MYTYAPDATRFENGLAYKLKAANIDLIGRRSLNQIVTYGLYFRIILSNYF